MLNNTHIQISDLVTLLLLRILLALIPQKYLYSEAVPDTSVQIITQIIFFHNRLLFRLKIFEILCQLLFPVPYLPLLRLFLGLFYCLRRKLPHHTRSERL